MEPDWSFHQARPADPEPSPAAVRLAAALAERLDAVLPPPFRAHAEGGWVALYHDSAWNGSTGVAGVLDQELDAAEPGPEDADAGPRPLADLARTVAWNVLSSAQDAVAEATTNPWPVLPGGGMALPGARADDAWLHLWYGPHYDHEAGAVPTLAPIPLAVLEQPG